MQTGIETREASEEPVMSVATSLPNGKDPHITVVTVVLNGAETLEKTILSVINQSYSNYDYIIIDGGSTDGTIEIIRKYEHAIYSWLSEPDFGLYDAMNKGAGLARGEWINFMNCGDVFSDPGVLSGMAGYLVNSLDVVCGDVEIIQKDRTIRKKSSLRQIRIPILGMPGCHQSMFIRTKWLKRFPYNVAFGLAADFDNICSILISGGKVEGLPAVISRVSAGGISRENRLDVYRQYEKIHDTHFGKNLHSSIYYVKRRLLVRIKKIAVKLRLL